MRILVAPNSLKGSLDAFSVARAIAEGLLRGCPGAETMEIPIADGGDLTAAVLVDALGGAMLTSLADDPLGRPRLAQWGVLGDGRTAVVDAASASGLSLLGPAERDPMVATSYGTGQLIRAALDRGYRRLLVGVGGTATLDAGAGLLMALGAGLLDREGVPIERGGAGLAALHRIDLSGLDPRLHTTEIRVACDVDNELLGERGAAPVFGPQKGATPEMVRMLASNLVQFADVAQRDTGVDVRTLPHGGAGGGMAAGMAALLGAQLVPGIDLVLDYLHFGERLDRCDLVVTAEGWIDRQTLANKGPYGVALAAQRRGIPVVILAGGISDEIAPGDLSIFDAVVAIATRPMTLDEAMARAPELVARAAEQIGRLLRLGGSLGQRRRERPRV